MLLSFNCFILKLLTSLEKCRFRWCRFRFLFLLLQKFQDSQCFGSNHDANSFCVLKSSCAFYISAEESVVFAAVVFVAFVFAPSSYVESLRLIGLLVSFLCNNFYTFNFSCIVAKDTTSLDANDNVWPKTCRL